MSKAKVVQINNQFIQEEVKKSQLYQAEKRKKNRFMGSILILVVFLFILPTYNLVASYNQLKEKEASLAELEARYQELTEQEKIESDLVSKLEDEDYALKYIRAKYQYSKEGELVYNIPGILPK